MPRFQEPHFSKNKDLLPEYRAIAKDVGCTQAQLSIARVLRQGSHIHAIPGTTSISHLEENWAALNVDLAADTIARLDALVNQDTVSGPRYPVATQAEIDTEEFR